MTFDKISERKLCLQDADTGQQVDLCIEIGRPRWAEVDVEAVCPIFIRGLMNEPLDIYGSDLLNALECALGSINSELKNLPSTKKILWPGGESYFD